jgi:predicted Zn-ribbon and HTH transcriptional regulator
MTRRSDLPVTAETIALALVDFDFSTSEALNVGAWLLEHFDVKRKGTGLMVDTRPHSRACGLIKHDHGVNCSFDCPTCGDGGTNRV